MRRIRNPLAVPGVLVAALVLAPPAPARGQGTPPAADAPLARYVPKTDQLVALIEFAGTDAQAEAWKATAAYKILNDTPTGAMFEDLLTQLVDQIGGQATDRTMTGADAVEMLKFLVRSGFLIALSGDTAKPNDEHLVMVFRSAAKKENRPVTAKLLGGLMGPNPKTQKVVKGSRTIVEVVRPLGEKSVWWTEQDDLVFLARGGDLDAVLATLDGQAPNAADNPNRKALFDADGTFRPLGGLFIDFDQIERNPQAAAQLAPLGLSRFDFRWGFDGPALVSVTRLVAPAPRQGGLALLDQPTFDHRSLPPVPAGADSFTALSLDLGMIYDQIAKLGRSSPQGTERIEAMEKAVKDRTRRSLRDDYLGAIGPKMAFFRMPSKGGAAPGGNPLAGMGAGFQVPKAALIAEVREPEKFTRALDDLIILANRQLEAQLGGAAAGAEQPKAKGSTRKAAGGSGSSTPSAPKFQMTSPGTGGTSKTYVLKLPAQFQAMTNLSLTVSLGKKHLVIASAGDTAREALALEGKTDGRWAPSGDLAASLGRLPEGRLIMLQVSDPRETLPQGLANLPTIATAISTAMAQAAKGQGMPGIPGLPPGLPGAAGPGDEPGDAGGRPAAPGGGSNVNRRKLGLAGGPPAGGAGPPPNAGPGSAAPGAAPTFELKLDPAKAPAADQIRPLLFPGSTALAVDQEGVRLITRSSFPNVMSPSGAATGGAVVALLLPAVKAAREAAHKAVERNAAAAAALAGAGSGEEAVGAYLVRVPAGYAPINLPVQVPGNVTARNWGGAKNPDGSTSVLQMVVAPVPPGASMREANQLVDGFYTGLKATIAKSGLTHFQEDGREEVELGGRKYVKLTYSAGPAPDRRPMRGLALLTIDDGVVLTFASTATEGREAGMPALLEAMAASARKPAGAPAPAGAAPGANPP